MKKQLRVALAQATVKWSTVAFAALSLGSAAIRLPIALHEHSTPAAVAVTVGIAADALLFWLALRTSLRALSFWRTSAALLARVLLMVIVALLVDFPLVYPSIRTAMIDGQTRSGMSRAAAEFLAPPDGASAVLDTLFHQQSPRLRAYNDALALPNAALPYPERRVACERVYAEISATGLTTAIDPGLPELQAWCLDANAQHGAGRAYLALSNLRYHPIERAMIRAHLDDARNAYTQLHALIRPSPMGSQQPTNP